MLSNVARYLGYAHGVGSHNRIYQTINVMIYIAEKYVVSNNSNNEFRSYYLTFNLISLSCLKRCKSLHLYIECCSYSHMWKKSVFCYRNKKTIDKRKNENTWHTKNKYNKVIAVWHTVMHIQPPIECHNIEISFSSAYHTSICCPFAFHRSY